MSDVTNLREQLWNNKDAVRTIDAGQLEDLVAELLAWQGYRVQTAPPNRDGGYDMLALRKDLLGLETTTVIQCKRYPLEKKVNASQVRGLYGVKTFLGASNAVFVTNSGFTLDATRFVEGRYDVQLIGADQLLEWITAYKPPVQGRSFIEQRRFYSSFISHSSRDMEFVETLNSKLRSVGVKVWYAPEDLIPGRKLRDQIKKAIRSFDKLILVLSSNSMSSNWVITEIRDAIRREAEEGKQVLFPIGLASIEEIKAWECFDPDTGKDMAIDVRQYFIPNFVNWKNDAIFQEQFRKLLEGLTDDDAIL